MFDITVNTDVLAHVLELYVVGGVCSWVEGTSLLAGLSESMSKGEWGKE